MTDKARFFKKKFGGPNLGSMGQNEAQNAGFFIEFGSYAFLEIACSDSLQQFLTSNRSKTHEKKFGAQNLGQVSQNLAQN